MICTNTYAIFTNTGISMLVRMLAVVFTLSHTDTNTNTYMRQCDPRRAFLRFCVASRLCGTSRKLPRTIDPRCARSLCAMLTHLMRDDVIFVLTMYWMHSTHSHHTWMHISHTVNQNPCPCSVRVRPRAFRILLGGFESLSLLAGNSLATSATTTQRRCCCRRHHVTLGAAASSAAHSHIVPPRAFLYMLAYVPYVCTLYGECSSSLNSIQHTNMYTQCTILYRHCVE